MKKRRSCLLKNPDFFDKKNPPNNIEKSGFFFWVIFCKKFRLSLKKYYKKKLF